MKNTPLALAGLLLAVSSTAAIAEASPNSLSQFTIGGYVGKNDLRLSNTDIDLRFHGSGAGGSIQFAPSISGRNNLLFIADYAHENNETRGLELNWNRFNFTAALMSSVGKNAHWFTGAKYSSHRLEEIDTGATMHASTKPGYGVIGGVIFPFANQWTLRGSLGVSHFPAKDDDASLDLGVADSSIEFQPIPLMGITLGVQANYYISNNDYDTRTSCLSGRVGLNFHF